MKLPDSVQEIADVIGVEQTLLLISNLPRAYSMRPSGSAGSATRESGKQHKSGTGRVIMYVPTVPRLTANHVLVQILGWYDAIRLCKAFGGEIMHPANCAEYFRGKRDAEIMRLVSTGMPSAAVAEVVGMSERHVRNLVRSHQMQVMGVMMEKPPEAREAAANDNAPIDNKART